MHYSACAPLFLQSAAYVRNRLRMQQIANTIDCRRKSLYVQLANVILTHYYSAISGDQVITLTTNALNHFCFCVLDAEVLHEVDCTRLASDERFQSLGELFGAVYYNFRH